MVKEFSQREKSGVYFKVIKTGRIIVAGDQMEVISTPGHGVSCARWYRYGNPQDAQRLLWAHGVRARKRFALCDACSASRRRLPPVDLATWLTPNLKSCGPS